MAQLTQEQLEQIGVETQHATRKALSAWLRGAAVAFALAIGGTGYAVHEVDRASHKADVQAQQRLDQAVWGSCRRLNILRAQSNLSDAVSFRVLTQAAGGRFRHFASNLRVTPVTNCEQAVKNPSTYRAPVATPIGDTTTGKLRPEVVRILRDSVAYLKAVN
jgi:uncharacterized protein HemX